MENPASSATFRRSVKAVGHEGKTGGREGSSVNLHDRRCGSEIGKHRSHKFDRERREKGLWGGGNLVEGFESRHIGGNFLGERTVRM